MTHELIELTTVHCPHGKTHDDHCRGCIHDIIDDVFATLHPKPEETMDELREDRDAWKQAHEDLLAVRQQDLEALS